MNHIGADSFLTKYLETKIDEGVRQIIRRATIWASSSKNISPSMLVCFFFFPANLVFRFNLMLIEQFSPQFIYLFIFWYCTYLQVYPVPLCFFIGTPKSLMRLNVFWRFTAAKCSCCLFIFHEIFVPVNNENYSWR